MNQKYLYQICVYPWLILFRFFRFYSRLLAGRYSHAKLRKQQKQNSPHFKGGVAVASTDGVVVSFTQTP